MNSFMPLVGTIGLLGSALVGGVFFAFSSFVMKALARLPSSQGITAMQSINIVVINPSFLGAFFGTALLSLGMVVLVLVSRSHPSAIFFLGGAILYFAGTFLVTIFANVPLNDQLAAISVTDPAATKLWEYYLHRWTMWNHFRTAAAMVAALLFSLGLLQTGIQGRIFSCHTLHGNLSLSISGNNIVYPYHGCQTSGLSCHQSQRDPNLKFLWQGQINI